MATTIREFLVKLGVKADQKSVDKFNQGVTTLTKNLTQVVAVAAGAATGLVALAQSAANQGDTAAKQAKQVGLTAESLQEYAHAAELSGVSQETIISGAGRLARGLRDAQKGVGKAGEVMNELGVEFLDANGKLLETDVTIERLADKIAEMPDSFNKTALTMDLFGRSGAQMIPLLNSGGEGIREMRQEARDLGIVISNEAAAQAEEFNDSLFRLKQIVKGVRNTIGVALIPIITRVATNIKEWYLANREVIQQRLEEFVVKLSDAVKDLVDFMVDLNAKVMEIGGWEVVMGILKGMVEAFVAFKVIKTVIASVQVLQGIFGVLGAVSLATLGPIILAAIAVATHITLITLAVQDFIGFLQGKDSILGRFLNRLDSSGELAQRLRDAFGRVKVALTAAFERITAAAGKFVDTVWPLIKPLAKFLLELGVDFASIMVDALSWVLDKFVSFVEWYAGFIEDMTEFWAKFIESFVGGFRSAIGTITGLLSKVSSAFDSALDVIPDSIKATLGIGGAGGAAAQDVRRTVQLGSGGASGGTSIGGDRIEMNVDASGSNVDARQLAGEMDKKLRERDRRKAQQLSQRFRGREI